MQQATASWVMGKSLPAELYNSETVFSSDLDWLMQTQWFLAGHSSQISDAGDFFLFQMGQESVIVNRNQAGDVRAFHNTCRHRGSRVCLEQQGRKRLFTCPYHAWSYDLDGALVAARSMPAEFDKHLNGLLPLRVEVFNGLIFISFNTSDCTDFSLFTQRFEPMLRDQGLAQAKVAARKVYPTRANWKLVVENFFECYHCKSAHPTYCKVHDEMKLLAFGSDDSKNIDSEIGADMQGYRDQLAEWQSAAKEKGYPTGMFADGPDSLHLQASSRLPIGRGAVTESVDGKPLAPLMSELSEFDGGQTGCVFTPLATVLVCNDHAVVFTFLPMESHLTHVEAVWLVCADALEGRDYHKADLMHVWDTTLMEDKTITENNQLGVASRGYSPGTLSDHEARIADFGKWYMQHLLQGQNI